jgi:quercetin dioxygenase-like cupin family protein
MHDIMNSASIIAIFAVALVNSAAGQEKHQVTGKPGEAIHRPNEIKWQKGPPSIPAGAEFAILEGDPTKEGVFTMRIRLPDGYKIPPHIHPATEHVTVISGTFNFGMGEKFDKSATQEMPAGTFGFWPAGMKHFVWVKGETVVQLHGVGPWRIEYLNPADDPRKAKETGSK